MKKASNKQDFRGLDKDQRKQKVIDTAIELFHEKGYRTTTLDDVSKELGITKAALYNYISGKENLLSMIYLQALERIFQDTNKISRMNLPPDEKIKLIIRNHIQNIIIRSVSMFHVFFTEENQLPKKDFKKIQKQKNKYNYIVEKIIVEGISQGLFRKTDPKLISFGIIGMCNWVYKWYKSEYSFDPDQITNHFIGLLEKGYLKNEVKKDHTDYIKSDGDNNKNEFTIKKGIYKKLNTQCQNLMETIDEIKK